MFQAYERCRKHNFFCPRKQQSSFYGLNVSLKVHMLSFFTNATVLRCGTLTGWQGLEVLLHDWTNVFLLRESVGYGGNGYQENEDSVPDLLSWWDAFHHTMLEQEILHQAQHFPFGTPRLQKRELKNSIHYKTPRQVHYGFTVSNGLRVASIWCSGWALPWDAHVSNQQTWV